MLETLFGMTGHWRACTALASAIFVVNGALIPRVEASEVQARPTAAFLDSIGVVSTFEDRGQPYARTLEMLRYGGFRWLRGGIEGLTDTGPVTIESFIRLHQEAGVKISWGLGSGISDLDRLLSTGRILARAGALLAFEGNNEPNNWPITYSGKKGAAGLPGCLWRNFTPTSIEGLRRIPN